MSGCPLQQRKDREVIWGVSSNKHVKVVSEEVLISGRIPSPAAIRLGKLTLTMAVRTFFTVADTFGTFHPGCYDRGTIAGKREFIRVNKSLFHRLV